MAKYFDAAQAESVKLDGFNFTTRKAMPTILARRHVRRERRANRAL